MPAPATGDVLTLDSGLEPVWSQGAMGPPGFDGNNGATGPAGSAGGAGATGATGAGASVGYERVFSMMGG